MGLRMVVAKIDGLRFRVTGFGLEVAKINRIRFWGRGFRVVGALLITIRV